MSVISTRSARSVRSATSVSSLRSSVGHVGQIPKEKPAALVQRGCSQGGGFSEVILVHLEKSQSAIE